MKSALAFLVVLGMLGIEVCRATCPTDTIPFGNSCYYFSSKTTAVSWKDAKLACESRNMTLAIVEDEGEDLFLTCKATKNKMSLWLDGTDQMKEDKWIWSSTGQKIRYFNWNKPDDQPDGCRKQNCLAIHKRSKKGKYYSWYDASCSKKKFGYVCELELQVHDSC